MVARAPDRARAARVRQRSAWLGAAVRLGSASAGAAVRLGSASAGAAVRLGSASAGARAGGVSSAFSPAFGLVTGWLRGMNGWVAQLLTSAFGRHLLCVGRAALDGACHERSQDQARIFDRRGG